MNDQSAGGKKFSVQLQATNIVIPSISHALNNIEIRRYGSEALEEKIDLYS